MRREALLTPSCRFVSRNEMRFPQQLLLRASPNRFIIYERSKLTFFSAPFHSPPETGSHLSSIMLNQVSKNLIINRTSFSSTSPTRNETWICNLEWTRSHVLLLFFFSVRIKIWIVRRTNYANYRLNFISRWFLIKTIMRPLENVCLKH